MSPTRDQQKANALNIAQLFFNHNHRLNHNNNQLSIVNNNVFDVMPVLQPILDFDDSDEYMDEIDGNIISSGIQLATDDQIDGRRRPKTNGKTDKRSRYMGALVAEQGPTFLFIESFVWILCGYHASDDHNRRHLYYTICRRLQDMKLIGDTFKLDALHKIRQFVCQGFNQMVRQIKTGGTLTTPLPLPTLGSLSAQSMASSDGLVEKSSYFRDEFIDLGLIEKGGFGIVKKAKYRFDDCIYAVKIIKFNLKSATDFKKIIREVHLYANLSSHPNVVGYKNAWIENWSPNEDKKPLVKHMKTSASHSMREQTESSDEEIDITSNVTENDMSIRFEETSKSGIRIESSVETAERKTTTRMNGKVIESEEEVSDEDDDNSNDFIVKTKESRDKWTASRQTVVKRKKTQSISSPTLVNEASFEYRNSYELQRYKKRVIIAQNKVENCESNANPFISTQIGAILYIQMELCKQNLKSWIRERNDTVFKRFDTNPNYILNEEDIKTVKNIFRQILKGVEYIHSQHLIHRDLKPQNILFSSDGSKVKIGDFGLATIHNSKEISVDCIANTAKSTAGDTHEHTGGIGTSIYAAPEQKVIHPDKSYDQKSDLYSLGIILFELFYPLSTDMEKVKCVSNMTKKRQLPPTLTTSHPNVHKVILDLTHPNPALRPNATQVLHSFLFLNEEKLIIKQIDEQNKQLIHEMTVKDNRINVLEKELRKRNEEVLERDLMIESLKKQLQELSLNEHL